MKGNIINLVLVIAWSALAISTLIWQIKVDPLVAAVMAAVLAIHNLIDWKESR